jgi:ribosomal protein S18 acetylase RimI-like enzyme
LSGNASPTRFNVATSAERDAVVALWETCGLTRPWNDAAADFDLAVASPDADIILLRTDGQIIGSAMVGHDGHRGALYYLAIDPAHQRLGMGRNLMRAVEDWLKARNIAKLNLLVRHENAAVIGFYTALGYADTQCLSLGKRLDG